MNVNSFFKILNKKIDMYDKAATNPFVDKKRIIVIWVEEYDEDYPNLKEY